MRSRSASVVATHRRCFACGQANSEGLHLHFEKTETGVAAEFMPQNYHSGYPGILHGGLASTILDSAMTNCLLMNGVSAKTARLNIRFRGEIRIDTPLEVTAVEVSHKGRVHKLTSQIIQEGKVKAEAEASFMREKDTGKVLEERQVV